jgi:single stranded DNA-binding protein
VDEPLWLTIVAWRNLATQVEKYVKKGSQVLVSGRLSVDTYTDKDNRKQTGIEIVALDVRFLNQRPKNGNEPQEEHLNGEAASGLVKTALPMRCVTPTLVRSNRRD